MTNDMEPVTTTVRIEDLDDRVGGYLDYNSSGAGATLSPTGRARVAGFEDIDVDGIVDMINDHRADDGDGVEFPGLVLPGFGEKRDTCGEPIPHGCDSCGKPVSIGQTCYNPDCERCAPAWAKRRTGNVVKDQSSYGAQVLSLRALYQAIRQERIYYHHIVVSYPKRYQIDLESDDGVDALKKMRDVTKEIALELGLEGGVIGYHSYRVDDDSEGQGDSRGEWKNYLFQGLDWREVREELAFGPHFHIIGVGSHVVGDDVTKIIEQETRSEDGPGVIIKRITERDDNSNVSIYGETELAKVISYVLSHTPVYDAGDTRRGAMWRFGPDVNMTTPTEEMEAEMDYEARRVAPLTLGLPFSSMVCTLEDEENNAQVHDPQLAGLADGDDDAIEATSSNGHDHHHGHDHSAADPRMGGTAESLGGSAGGFTLAGSTIEWSGGGGTWTPGGSSRTFDVGGIVLSNGSEAPDPDDLPREYLDVLEDAKPQEIIDNVVGVLEENVWEYKNKIRNAAGREVCGGRLLRGDRIIDRHLSDPEWREQAEHVDEFIDVVQEVTDEWADEQPHTYASLWLRSLRDNFDDLPDELRISRDQVTGSG
ncbi:MAG: hypothetical protein ACOCUO_02055 [archaeon]